MRPTMNARFGKRVGLALLCGLLPALLSPGGASGAPDPLPKVLSNPAARGTEAPLRVLVAPDAQSPVLNQLEQGLGDRLRLRSTRDVASTDPSRWDLLVVDGDVLTPAQMARRELLASFTAAAPGSWPSIPDGPTAARPSSSTSATPSCPRPARDPSRRAGCSCSCEASSATPRAC